ncbi:MAG: LysR substrate-binding domain-containing protein [Dermatophilaceae bacterium]
MAVGTTFDPGRWRAELVVRAGEAVIVTVAPSVARSLATQAPGVRLRWEVETATDVPDLRAGEVALAIGSFGDRTSDLGVEPLLDEQLVGVVRRGHPVVRGSRSQVDLETFAALEHVVATRRGHTRGPVDRELAGHGLRRSVAVVVPTFTAAVSIAAGSDLTAVAPRRLVDLPGAADLIRYRLPLTDPTVQVVQCWHARNSFDPGHRWLRRQVRAAVTTGRGRSRAVSSERG